MFAAVCAEGHGGPSNFSFFPELHLIRTAWPQLLKEKKDLKDTVNNVLGTHEVKRAIGVTGLLVGAITRKNLYFQPAGYAIDL